MIGLTSMANDHLIGSENAPAKPGRPKGSPNKLGKAAKDVIAEAAAGLGGADRLLTWAQEAPENEKAFWTTIYPKLLPLTISGDKDNPLDVVTRIELVAPSVSRTD